MNKLKSLIEEQTSPLFRIMSAYNFADLNTHYFQNNISCFHIGKGYFLSVFHNLRTKNIPRQISEVDFLGFFKKVSDPLSIALLQKHYILNHTDLNRNLSDVPINPVEQGVLINQLLAIFQNVQHNTSTEEDYSNNKACPVLVVQFKNNEFYNDSKLTQKFKPHQRLHEPNANRYTFLLEAEIVKTFYEDDICIYKLKEVDNDIWEKIPSLKIDFNLYDNLSEVKLFCLQSSPSSELGRMLNTATIDGIADHWSNFSDLINTNYLIEGKRYITKNYFRFGSSGAPYIIYNKENDELYFNAVQSEAAPIQMTILNNRDGNLQYTHAIATPLNNVEEYLMTIM
ncbi:MAG: hypothetical protein GZ086_07915 [Gelidibacter sp.]|nr:hypothetical protein [Gelidibacter sp.]